MLKFSSNHKKKSFFFPLKIHFKISNFDAFYLNLITKKKSDLLFFKNIFEIKGKIFLDEQKKNRFYFDQIDTKMRILNQHSPCD